MVDVHLTTADTRRLISDEHNFRLSSASGYLAAHAQSVVATEGAKDHFLIIDVKKPKLAAIEDAERIKVRGSSRLNVRTSIGEGLS